MSAALHEVDEVLLGFTHALRAAGVAVTQDRSQSFLAAVAEVGADDGQAVWWAGRATLCASPDDLFRHDQVFAAWFNARDGLPQARPRDASRPATAHLLPDAEGAGGGDSEAEDEDVVRAAASAAEVLRHRDVASLDAAEKRRLARDVRPALAAPAHPAYGPAPEVAPRRGRRVPHPATLAAPPRRTGRDRLAASRASDRGGWCCWST